MDLLLDLFVTKAFLLEALGIVGIGLLGLAAVRLSQRYRSWGGSLLASGALLLLLGRLWVTVSGHVVTPQMMASMGNTFGEIISLAPMALLTMGLAGIVWGLWGHEQWLREER